MFRFVAGSDLFFPSFILHVFSMAITGYRAASDEMRVQPLNDRGNNRSTKHLVR
jgi:hypothetical protein